MLKGGDQSQDFLLRVINPDTEPHACLQSEFGMEYLGTVMSGSDGNAAFIEYLSHVMGCLLYTSPSPRDRTRSRMPSSA